MNPHDRQVQRRSDANREDETLAQPVDQPVEIEVLHRRGETSSKPIFTQSISRGGSGCYALTKLSSNILSLKAPKKPGAGQDDGNQDRQPIKGLNKTMHFQNISPTDPCT